jgi:Integrase zinc binding domain
MGKSNALSYQADHGSSANDNEDIILLTPDLFAIRALEGLELVGEEEILREIRREMESGGKEEAVAKAVEELQKMIAYSVQSSEWLQSQGLLYFCGKIYVPDLVNLQWWIAFLCHDTKIAEHCGRWKTLELVSCNYWWPQMSRYIGKYVSTCDMCLCTKAFCQPLIGELHPLPVPDAPWNVISVDFVSELPDANGKDCIIIVVDSITEHSYFVDTVTTISAISSARLYVKHIHMETPWPTQKDVVRSGSAICSGIYEGVILPSWN